IEHCRIKQLGAKENLSPDKGKLLENCEGLIVDAAGKTEVAIEHCVFDECNSVIIRNHENSTARFCYNTLLENAAFPVGKAAHLSRLFFSGEGASKEPKFFQGNNIYKGGASFPAPNWL